MPHHCVDILPPEAPFSVADFTALAGQRIGEIAARGRLPILVGGTGLYVQSLLYGVRFAREKAPRGCGPGWRQNWKPGALRPCMHSCRPWTPKPLRPSIPTTMCGCCGRWSTTRPPAAASAARRRIPCRQSGPTALCVLGLDFADRADLYRRIDVRVDRMMEQGLEEEARLVYQHRQSYSTAAQAIGYKELFRILRGRPLWRTASKSSSRPPAATPSGS